MRFGIILSARLFLISFILIAASLCAVSQTIASKDVQATPSAVSGKRTTLDETFDLNIAERRFTRINFEASTAVGTDADAALNLQIGVGLAADRIDVELRNVQGSIRFHGSIERILQVINNRDPVSPQPPPR